MSRVDTQAARAGRQLLGYALLILPAVGLGVLAMIRGGVSPMLWGQQAAAWIVFALLAWPLRRVIKRIPTGAQSVLLLALLAAALLGEEVEGVRRWLDLGVFNINTAMLVLPALLIVLCSMKCPYPVLLGAAAVLCVQPDLSQLTAFAAAVLPLLWRRRNERLWTTVCVLTLAALVICCLRFPAAVAPVDYCEGILTMLGERSPLLMAAGVIALLAVPAFFIYRFFRIRQPHLLGLAAYYAASLLFGFFGEYPVLFMGFGLSPIAGYYLAYSCGSQAAQA